MGSNYQFSSALERFLSVQGLHCWYPERILSQALICLRESFWAWLQSQILFSVYSLRLKMKTFPYFQTHFYLWHLPWPLFAMALCNRTVSTHKAALTLWIDATVIWKPCVCMGNKTLMSLLSAEKLGNPKNFGPLEFLPLLVRTS